MNETCAASLFPDLTSQWQHVKGILCRWDIVRPEKSQTGDWEMAVSATKAIEAGEDAWLSYSTEPGSQFLLHYGFV